MVLVYPGCYNPVVHNVRPAGHIQPAMSPDVARDVQQEND